MTELYAGACLYAREQHPTEVPAFIACMAERFAELIVRECCEVLRQEVEVALSADGDPVDPEGLVRKHFGVSE